eukprot:Rmarinus@m.10115
MQSFMRWFALPSVRQISLPNYRSAFGNIPKHRLYSNGSNLSHLEDPAPFLKKRLRQLIHRVHPDRFASVPTQYVVNDKALKDVNSIYSDLQNLLKSSSLEEPIGVEFKKTVCFFHAYGSDQSIDHTIYIPSHYSLKQSIQVFDYCLYSILRNANVPIPDDEVPRPHAPAGSQSEDVKPDVTQQPPPRPAMTPNEEAIEEVRQAVLRGADELHSDNSGLFLNRTGVHRTLPLRKEMIFFDKDLAADAGIQGLRALDAARVSANYNAWAHLPILLSREFSITKAPGMITIPTNFTPLELRSYLRSNLATIDDQWRARLQHAWGPRSLSQIEDGQRKSHRHEAANIDKIMASLRGTKLS